MELELARLENEALRAELAVLRERSRVDASELVALRDKVRRLNNELLAVRASRAPNNSGVAASSAAPPSPTIAGRPLSPTPQRDKQRDAPPLSMVRFEGDEPASAATTTTTADEGEETKSPRTGGFFRHFRKQQPPSPRSGSSDSLPKTAAVVASSPPNASVSSPTLAATTGTVPATNASGVPVPVSSPMMGLARASPVTSLTVNILSAKRVGRHTFFLLGFRRSKNEEFVIVPRLYQDFRELHAMLVKELGEVVVPELKRIAATEKDTQVALQTYLDNLSNFDATADFPAFRESFLDPLYMPSFYTLTEVLKASKQGRLQMMNTMNKTWRQHSLVLLESLYIFRSEDDVHPMETLDLEWVTIEIVTVKQEPCPPFVFKICNLENATETFIGCDSTKEVGEWILALREAKVRKKGQGFWVKAAADTDSQHDDAAVVPESLVNRRAELEAASSLFRQWLENKEPFAVKSSMMQIAKSVDATPIPINFEQEAQLGKSVLLKEGSNQILGGTRQRFLALLLGVPLPVPETAANVSSAASGASAISSSSTTSSSISEDRPAGPVFPLSEAEASSRILEDIEGILAGPLGGGVGFEEALSRSPRDLNQQRGNKASMLLAPSVQMLDESFVEPFLLVFRLFLSTQELFLTIVQRFLSVDSGDLVLRTRCAQVLHRLVQLHWCEFAQDARLARQLLEFVTMQIDSRFPDIGKLIRDAIAAHALPPDERAAKLWSKSAPKPILPDMYQRNTFDFIDLNPVEVARQLTILEHQLFSAIEGRELLNQCWNKDNKEVDAPNVTLTIRRFNQMSGWITSLIVKVKPLKPRVALVRRFIEIADACMQLNNFNSVAEIVSGLQTSAVKRLTDTFAELPADTALILTQLREFLETRKNWERYRSRLSSLSGVPCVPYLGLYLTDLTMIDEAMRKTVAHPEHEDVTLLNFERASRIAAVHAEIRRFQADRYRLQSISYLQEYLSRLDQMSEDECYALSLELQARKKEA